MKKAILYFLVSIATICLLIVSLVNLHNSLQAESITKKQKPEIDNKKFVTKTLNEQIEYVVHEVDSCQYLVFFSSYHSLSVIHKVNCKNKIHSK